MSAETQASVEDARARIRADIVRFPGAVPASALVSFEAAVRADEAEKYIAVCGEVDAMALALLQHDWGTDIHEPARVRSVAFFIRDRIASLGTVRGALEEAR